MNHLKGVATKILDALGSVINPATEGKQDDIITIMSTLGVVDTNNETTTPLLSGQTFTGTATDITNYASIGLMVYTDVNSANDGLVVQYSFDGTTWRDGEAYTIPAGTAKFFTPPKQGKYYRVKYTNNGDDQTEFHIHSLISKVPIKWSSHNLNDNLRDDDDGTLSVAVIKLRTAQDTYVSMTATATGNAKISLEEYDETFLTNPLPVQLRDSSGVELKTADSKLRTSSMPYTYDIAEGNIAGHEPLLKFGTRESVAAATESTFWEGPTARYVYLTSAEQLKISSTSTNDTSAGTGARTMIIYGLDSNYDEINETVTLNGTTVVTTTASFFRVFRAIILTSGTLETNDGTISIKNNAGTVTQALINPGDAQTLMTMWTVPRGKTAYIIQGGVSTSSNKGARISLFTRQANGGTIYPWQIKYRGYIFSGANQIPRSIPFVVPEKVDIEMRVLTPASAGTTSVGGTFELWYE